MMGPMRSDEVLAVLGRLAAEGITAWLDGGWGVDALLEEQTREHADLDLVIDRGAVDRLRSSLAADGFEVIRDWLPTAVALCHADGREIDLHPVEMTDDGGGDQIQLDGVKRWHYDPPTIGRIAGCPVPCSTVATQIRSHLGYDPDDVDVADMEALARRFGCSLPPPYDRS
jgi:lincosamide nucleotidyltransferase A/C/D/E